MYELIVTGNMSLERTLYKHQVEISFIALVTGMVLFAIGLSDIVLSNYIEEEVLEFSTILGNWTYWFLVIGGFLVLVFGWYFIDRVKNINKFKDLMDTTSKSKFIKNIAEIETLALSLGKKYEDQVTEREKEYKIKR